MNPSSEDEKDSHRIPNDEHQDSDNSEEKDPVFKVKVFKGDPDKITKYELSAIMASVIVVVFNIFTLIYVREQTKTNIQAVNDAKTQFDYQRNRDSINAIKQNAKDSVFALNQKTRDSLNLESFILENRAYLCFKNISPIQLSVGHLPTFDWEVTNTGKTPAYRVRHITQWHPDIDYTDNEFNSLRASVDTGQVIGAGLPYDHTSSAGRIIEDSLQLSATRKESCYIGIIVEYEDFFHKSRRTRAHIMSLNDTLYYMRNGNDAN